jgi:uncharacterized protein YbjT (DUF2867 family)
VNGGARTVPAPGERLVLLAGATGYVGGRLLAALQQRGERLRCLARRPEQLRARVSPEIEVVQGDALHLESLAAAMRGVDTAYYLIHSMGAADDFAESDRQAAQYFARAAAHAGVRRIIYLGGLGRREPLSPHLASRQEVGRILREGAVPTIEFRASIILGSGSLSFELIRGLVERLPVMLLPRWVTHRAQPIAIEDVISYLSVAPDADIAGSEIVEIGGPDQVSYADLMREYAAQRGLRRWMLRVPVLTPGLSSLWLGLVTPLYARVGKKLIDSIRNDTTVASPRARELFPGIVPRSVRVAIARALAAEDREFAETRWSDALSSRGRTQAQHGGRMGWRRVDSRAAWVAADPEHAFAPIRRIGGATGWYYADALWRLRGFLDLLVGGVGVRRGRRDPERVRPGDALDFWRVEAFESPRMMRLAAEMKVPGRAWLQFEVEPEGQGSIVRQTAIFDPRGLPGLLYWYGLLPVHTLMFEGMLRAIVRVAGDSASSPATARG